MTPTSKFDTIRTDRLLMRRWRDSDRAPFAALNGDPETMKFFLALIDSRYGGIDRWAEGAEIPPAVIASLRKTLVPRS